MSIYSIVILLKREKVLPRRKSSGARKENPGPCEKLILRLFPYQRPYMADTDSPTRTGAFGRGGRHGSMAATCAQSGLGRRSGANPPFFTSFLCFLGGYQRCLTPRACKATPRRRVGRQHPRLGGGSRAWARHTTCDARACTCTSSTTAPMTRPETLRASRAAHETQSGDGPSPSESATGHQAMRDGNQVPSSTQTSLDFLV